ncbi:hypothetical protein ACA910_001273 [Epithemia clementina (nom. ined.)]
MFSWWTTTGSTSSHNNDNNNKNNEGGIVKRLRSRAPRTFWQSAATQNKQEQQRNKAKHERLLAELPDNAIYRLEYPDIHGHMVQFSQFIGKVTLELAQLHTDLQRFGFSVLAFPSNSFHQELDSNEAIANFWSHEYPQATFFIFASSWLAENPIYQQLQRHLPSEHRVQHNFFKYLVNRQGVAVQLFHKRQDPLTLKGPILQLLHDDPRDDDDDDDTDAKKEDKTY